MNKGYLEYIFGKESEGSTAVERALSSKREFVRSQDHLSIWQPSATGRKLLAYEVFITFGIEKLQEVMDYGAAILPSSTEEPALTLTKRREALGLSMPEVARKLRISEAEVLDCENNLTRTPIRVLERVAELLGLDERKLSICSGASGDEPLATRLKTLGNKRRLTANSVMALSEAAWVIKRQIQLQKDIKSLSKIYAQEFNKFEKSNNYGSREYPVWDHGYFLARKCRELLNIDQNSPITSIREICRRLEIPLLQTELQENIAGATVDNNYNRGIVVNTIGRNNNVWIRRFTISHELGHLLWDPNDRLNAIQVDDYDEISVNFNQDDYVEARANAFAIAFLAPPSGVKSIIERNIKNPAAGIRLVMETFGISFIAARLHICNIMPPNFQRKISAINDIVDINPSDEWRARESFTHDYFPIEETSDLRRGEFSGFVVEAERNGLISKDTACGYLQTNQDKYNKKMDLIYDLFKENNNAN